MREAGYLLAVAADNAAGNSSSGITAGLGLQIVGTSMDDNRLANDAVLAGEGQEFKILLQGHSASVVGFNVAQIANMMRSVTGSAMFNILRIVVTAGRTGVRCRAITMGMNVEAVPTCG